MNLLKFIILQYDIDQNRRAHLLEVFDENTVPHQENITEKLKI